MYCTVANDVEGQVIQGSDGIEYQFFICSQFLHVCKKEMDNLWSAKYSRG